MIEWGVNSWNRANLPIGGHTLYERVTEWAHRRPGFWGRYIGRGSATTAPPLTPDEAGYLLHEGCRILVIYNAVGAAEIRGGYADGLAHANRALSAAKGISVPAGVRIYLDIEPEFQPSPDWLLGWWEGMKASPYAGTGGVYANPDMLNIVRPYGAALDALPLADRTMQTRYHWSTRPSRDGRPPPHELNDALFQPRRMGESRGEDPGGIAGAFAWNDPVVLWQSARECMTIGASTHGYVDLNYANEAGFHDLWF